MQDINDLVLTLRSGIPLIVLETHDEVRALEVLTKVAMKIRKGLMGWSITKGLDIIGFAETSERKDDPEDPIALLKAIKQHKLPSIFVLCDFHPYMEGNPEIVRHLKDIALAQEKLGHILVFLSHSLELPAEIKRYSAQFKLALPGDSQLAAIVREEIREWMKDNTGTRPNLNGDILKRLIANLKGTTSQDARRLIRSAIRDDGAITPGDIDSVNEAKYQLLDMDGLLSFEYDTRKMADVGGVENLKRWLQDRHEPFIRQDLPKNIDRPRGILLCGVQGSGKSLAAKAVAGAWQLPLLRLDMATLYNKYIGETEKNLRTCLEQAELMAPCVLWVDEIEKALAVSHNDDATSQRVLGHLLTWLSERQASVFLVATANHVSGLPAELLRKGRFDEVFFVDLPEARIREDIFSIHLQSREYNPEHFDITTLGSRSDGFSGAEIEQAIVSAIHVALARRTELDTELILEEIDNTLPLSVTMADKIQALRRWAAERTIRA